MVVAVEVSTIFSFHGSGGGRLSFFKKNCKTPLHGLEPFVIIWKTFFFLKYLTYETLK